MLLDRPLPAIRVTGVSPVTCGTIGPVRAAREPYGGRMTAPSPSLVVAGLALDLVDGPLGHHRLVDALRRAVRDGRLRAGTRLPPSRDLADALGCSRWVVTEAYGLLVAEGTLAARTGSGTWVLGAPPNRVPAPRTPPADRTPDLTPGVPELGSFPRAPWKKALAAALATAAHDELAVQGALGLPRLRTELGHHVARTRGAVVSDRTAIGVTRGSWDTIDRLFRILRRLGLTEVAVEAPVEERLRVLARGEGLTVVPIGADARGLRIEDLTRTSVRAVVVAPTVRHPSSRPMAPDRRDLLMRWAREVDAVVIEHDRDGPLASARRAPVLQASGPDRVILVGSWDTSLGPGLGIGWLLLPAHWLRSVAPTLPAMSAPPALDQLALIELISNGDLDRHVRRMRARYRTRGRLLHAALTGALPGWTIQVADGGYLVATMPPGSTAGMAAEVVDSARGGGLALTRIEDGAGGPDAGASAFAVGFANLRDAQIDTVAAGIAAAVLRVDRSVDDEVRVG